MFAPKLYDVRKIPAIEIIRAGMNVIINNDDYIVAQQDCMMFRHIRNITKSKDKYIPYIVFIDCNGAKGKKEEIKSLVTDGFCLNGVHFSSSERSASMTRNSIIGFLDSSIIEEIDKIITMDLEMKTTVLSKYCAYRGLMFSSCHCLDGYFPKIIIVSDYKKMITGKKIKYLVEKRSEYKDKDTGEDKIWVSSDIEEGIKDVPLNVFDGCGIHHPAITEEIQSIIQSDERPTTLMLRAPYIKGLSLEVDYTLYFHEHGVDFIQDVWGKWHSVDEKMFILTESMYKGIKYFKKDGTSDDWDNYWSKFHKYNHCLGIAKWNFTQEQEPVYTRSNYQILQDLDLDFDEFKLLSGKSLEWAEKVTSGDPTFSYCFMGLSNENPKPLNAYAKAVLKNPHMLKEDCVRDFLKKQTRQYIDKMKCGKLYIKSCYKFWIPDIIMLLEWIGGDKNPIGSLKDGEFWSIGYTGEHLIERNPHICKSEHLALIATTTKEIEKYCSHLVNTCMVNSYGLSCARLNGADYPIKSPAQQ